MSDDRKKLLLYGLTALSLVIALVGSFFGIKMPMPPMPEDSGMVLERGLPATNIRELNVQHDAAIGGDATVGGGLTVVGTLTTGGVSTGTSTEWEGATANDYETTLAITDPTADRTVTFADASGTAMLSSLATNAADAANSVTGASNALLFEGATANAYEMSLAPADPGADVTVTIPAETGAVVVSSLATNATDAANSVTGASNKLVFEGATADAYETWFAPTDATADRTLTLPNLSGVVQVSNAAAKMIWGTDTITGTKAVTHGLTTPQQAFCTLAEDSGAAKNTCTVSISSSTATVKVWKADGTTAGDAGTSVNWLIIGQP